MTKLYSALATCLALTASAASGATVLAPSVDAARRILGFADSVEIVRWEVPDKEPMFAADKGDGHVAFFRAGEEQCMDKMLGAVPCEGEPVAIEVPDRAPVLAYFEIPPTLRAVPPLAIVPPLLPPLPPAVICCATVTPPPPVTPPPSPVTTPASWLLALSALMGLAAWRLIGRAA